MVEGDNSRRSALTHQSREDRPSPVRDSRVVQVVHLPLRQSTDLNFGPWDQIKRRDIHTPQVNAELVLRAAQRLHKQHLNIGVVVIAEAGDRYACELLRNSLLDDRVGDLE